MISRKLGFLGLVGVALIAAFFFVRRSEGPGDPAAPGTSAPAAKAARGPSGPLSVYTHPVVPRLLKEQITATGTLAADESVDLVSELSGKIVSIDFREDSKVSRGDVLLRIDDTELRAQLARAESRLNLAQAQARRQEQLGVGVGTSQDAFDAAMNELRVLEAEAEVVRTQLAKTEIRAPFDGRIGLRHVSEGAYLTPNTRIASLQKVDPIKIEFAVAERYLDRLQRDAQVRISVAGIHGSFTGTVYAFEPQVDLSTRMLRMRARAPNPDSRALPGGFATVEVPLRESPNAILVPTDALIVGLNEQHVYVIEEDRAVLRRVETGLRRSREIEILSGLRAGDTVITSGQLQLRPGLPVVSIPRDAEPTDDNNQ